jgi:hypothetical protein
MKNCDVCGNQYDKFFTVTVNNQTYTFGCFECAIHKLALRCSHCKCKIIGHGLKQNNEFYCCANCARKSGQTELKDRI